MPKGMVQVRARVLAHRRVAPDHFEMRLKAPAVARRALAGQFIHVRCLGDSPRERTVPLLRRPFSLLDADPRAETIRFLYKVVGLGTRTLAQIPAGSDVDLLGPLGRPFEVPAGLEQAVLVGGGVGIPPLVMLAKALVTGHEMRDTRRVKKTGQAAARVEVFLGARKKEWVICTSDFKKLGLNVLVATDDGSMGCKGSVVDLLQKSLPMTHDPPPMTVLYICGPTPMMQAAAKLARRERLPAQVSLEERMGCAMGVCWGCVVEVTNHPKQAHGRFQRVCTEGPVFPAEAILWKSC